MRTTRFFVTLVFTMLLALPVLAQKNYYQDAEAAFQSQSYFSAINIYKKAYSKEKNKAVKAEILFKIGECHRLIEDDKGSEQWYQKAIKAKYPEAEVKLYLAQALQKQGKYDDALVQYNEFLKEKPGDKRGSLGAESCKMAADWKENPTRWEVNNEALLNSKQYDFSPTFADKKNGSLLFTSTREGSAGSSVDTYTGESYSDLWYTKRDKKGKWGVPTPINAEINSDANEGSAFLNKKKNQMYFTRCPVEKKESKGCDIYVAKKMGQNWGGATMITIANKTDTNTAGHPTLSSDDRVMIFAADLAGGYGGKDLWMISYDKKGKSWSEPVNLGSQVNTAGNELFPFLHLDGTLYFASDGHPGMGGLDIFMAPKQGTEDKWGGVENMKYPINSETNDFGIIFEGNNTRGFLTSNRKGGKGGDDIYSFYMPPLVYAIQGTVVDAESGSTIADATVKLVDSDGNSYEVKSDGTGFFAFAEKDGGKDRYIKGGLDYQILVSAPDYLNGKADESTKGVEESTTFVHDFKLISTKKEEIEFPQVLYDLGSAELRPESKDSLDYLYQTLIDNPTIVIELSAHTDSRGSDGSNETLSLNRAKSCVDYLISKGIDADRLQAQGYGERKLIYTDPMIGDLATEEEREAAHQKNRRTVFSVVRTDYVPKETPATEGEGEGAGEGEGETPEGDQ